MWHSTSKYRRVIWQCNSKFKNDEKCTTPHIYEDSLKQAFIDAFNSLFENKEEILQGYEVIIQALTDNSKFDKESAKLQNECKLVAELIRKCVEENACTALNQAEYDERYNSLAERYENIKKELEGINEKRLERSAKRESIGEFIKVLEKSNRILTEFDEEFWNVAIEVVKVNSEKEIIFEFKDGMELSWNI